MQRRSSTVVPRRLPGGSGLMSRPAEDTPCPTPRGTVVGGKLIQRAFAAAKRIRDHRFHAIYRRLKDFTMIPQDAFIANLKLAGAAAAIPGAIVECGTWKGGMIAGIAMILGRHRDYYLFDSFAGLPPAEPIDGSAARRWQQDTGSPYYFNNCTAAESDAAAAMALAGISDARIVKGWFEETLPAASFPRGIALLRLDADWYQSTYQILSSLFRFVHEGGLIIVDDYYCWDGCARAVHDFLSRFQRPERISSYQGVCFIQKRQADEEFSETTGTVP